MHPETIENCRAAWLGSGPELSVFAGLHTQLHPGLCFEGTRLDFCSIGVDCCTKRGGRGRTIFSPREYSPRAMLSDQMCHRSPLLFPSWVYQPKRLAGVGLCGFRAGKSLIVSDGIIEVGCLPEA